MFLAFDIAGECAFNSRLALDCSDLNCRFRALSACRAADFWLLTFRLISAFSERPRLPIILTFASAVSPRFAAASRAISRRVTALCRATASLTFTLGSRATLPFMAPDRLTPASFAVCVARLPPLAVRNLPPLAVAPVLANLPRLSLVYLRATADLGHRLSLRSSISHQPAPPAPARSRR